MNESNIAGMSIRGIIAFVVITSLCGLCVWLHTAEALQILKDIALVILTFYYVQKGTQGGSNATPNTSTSTTTSTVSTDIKPS